MLVRLVLVLQGNLGIPPVGAPASHELHWTKQKTVVQLQCALDCLTLAGASDR
jgi:hypothetical protein